MQKTLIIWAISAFSIWSCTEKSADIPTTPATSKDTTQVDTSQLEAPDVVLQSRNKPVFFDYTSTGCPGCGSWGAPTFENLSEEYQDKIVPIAVHIKYGDPMITSISTDIAANRDGQRYTPQLWVNSKNAMVCWKQYRRRSFHTKYTCTNRPTYCKQCTSGRGSIQYYQQKHSECPI